MNSVGALQRLRQRYGPWAVVTGASDGIGREMAMYLARAGFSLVLAARREGTLLELATELHARYGVSHQVVAADLSQATGVQTLAETAQSLDIGLLIASAGYGTSGDFITADMDNELAMIDLNCRAVAALCHVFGRRLAQRRRGGIVLMSSIVAFQGVPRAANYAATKAYVQSLAEGLRFELGPRGVDVLACAPGPVRSGFAARASMVMGFAQTPRDIAAPTLQALHRRGTVRPGWLAKALEFSLKLLPRWGRVRMMKIIMAGMTPQRVRDARSQSASQ